MSPISLPRVPSRLRATFRLRNGYQPPTGLQNRFPSAVQERAFRACVPTSNGRYQPTTTGRSPTYSCGREGLCTSRPCVDQPLSAASDHTEPNAENSVIGTSETLTWVKRNWWPRTPSSRSAPASRVITAETSPSHTWFSPQYHPINRRLTPLHTVHNRQYLRNLPPCLPIMKNEVARRRSGVPHQCG